MKAALTFSRRKISSNVFLTDVVPAPEEPVTEMIGCFFDVGVGFPIRLVPVLEPHQTAAPEQWRTLR